MIGETIAHYKIIEKLGEGGMGVVYKAEDTKLDRLVALKFLPSHLIDDEKALSRLLKEAKAASKINHPNVCTIYDIKEYEDTQYIVMEYVDGETVKNKIKEAPLSINETVEYSEQICKALKAAHDKGITHRDIKSENIMINTENMVKVMDFGLAKLKDEARLSRTSATAGTIAYMAPEQIKGQDIDHRADIWALGVVIFEMLTCKFSFKGEYESAMSYSIVNTDPEPIKIFRSEVPAELELIIYKALAKSPDERYQSAGDVLDYLKKFRKELEIKISKEKAAAEKPKPSIAVLPFRNISADPEQDYFCEGMSEEIINALTHIENLKVIARTSAFAFKDKQEDVREIGKKLDVEHLLEGSVRKAGNRLRITAQLVKVSDGSHLWSERYDREMEDVFEIQDEISLSIVDKLKVKLLAGEKEVVMKRLTDNPELYNLYLLGRYHWNKFTEKDLKKSQEYFEQAIRLDPEYAPAYAGIGVVFMLLGGGGVNVMPPNTAIPKAKSFLEKAITIDPECGEAHAGLGYIYTHFEWNWREAEKHVRRAIEVEPNSAITHQCYAHYLSVMGNHEEAISEIELAIKLDPLAQLLYQNASWIYCYARQYDKALEYGKRSLEIYPDFDIGYFAMITTYFEKGMFEEAISIIKEKVSIPLFNNAFLGYAYGKIGKRSGAKQIIRDLEEQWKSGSGSKMEFALVHLGLGEIDESLLCLEEFANEPPAKSSRIGFVSYTTFIKVDPVWDPLRSEPRFKAVLKKMGLEK